MRRQLLAAAALAALAAVAAPRAARAQPQPETILQYFETSWSEITDRMPEIARAGYTAIWLPPPTKGAEGSADVGFSVFDRFDLGEYDQRGTIPTKYGTKAEVIRMVREAHRFGIKVYFDTVMNHNANPGKIENPGVTLPVVRIDEFPGTHPLDYHVLPARPQMGDAFEVKNAQIFGGGTYVLRPNTNEREMIVPNVPMPMGTNIPGWTHLVRAPWIDFNNAGPVQEQYLSLLGLIDFAIEQQVTASGPAANDGQNLVAEQPLPRFIRNADRPSTYPNNAPVAEDIREYFMRWIKWFGDTTDCDGLRLDAIKHVPPSFFKGDFPNDPIDFDGTFQRNLDARRGYQDANDDDGVDDALLFGESFTGDFNSLRTYREAGMYLLDFPLLFKLAHDNGVFSKRGEGDIGQLSFPQGGMAGAFNEFGGLGRTAGVAFVQSHDTPAPGAQPNSAYAYIMGRVGHSVVFFDGNNFNPNTFVQPGRLDALGELDSQVVTKLVDIRRRFARGGQFNRFVDGDVYVFERVVPTSDNSFGATLLVAITDNVNADARFGEFDPRPLIVTEFPPGTVLQELTGNGMTREVTVLDPMAVPANARNAALAAFDPASDFPLPSRYGLVYLSIPHGPDMGYVMYAPKTPPASVALTTAGAPLPIREVTTAPPRLTPAGAPIAASVIRAGLLGMGKTLTVRVTSDMTARRAFMRIDAGKETIPGKTPATGTPDGLYDGMIELPADPMGGFALADLDLAALAEGVHLVDVRVARDGTPSFYSETKVYLVIDRAVVAQPDAGVVIPADGGVIVNPTDGGGMPPPADAGVVIDQDPDRDGVPTGSDLCPMVADPAQSDFDGDRVGDACDLCADSEAGAPVDVNGCGVVPEEAARDLDAIVEAILDARYDAALDEDADGAISALDFVLRAKREVSR